MAENKENKFLIMSEDSFFKAIEDANDPEVTLCYLN